MILGLFPVTFRFRGKVGHLADIYLCFRDHRDQALHPAQVARYTGLPFSEVNARLEATPELFVKLPRRPDGLTRYRLTTATAAQSPEEIERFLHARQRKESLVVYALGAMLLMLLLIVVVLVGPAL
ncbi:MAG: hypothetical protein ACODAC_05935 [Pseudomonadota bacterium]